MPKNSSYSMDLTRTLVIGNSGSGKSWLAERIATSLAGPWVDLDLIHWEPGGYNTARSPEHAIDLTKDAAARHRWVIEGIYGWLVRAAEPNATALVWLCIDETECTANILHRGMRPEVNEVSFNALLRWADTYRTREGSSSFLAHKAIFDDFPRVKACLRSRNEVTAFANSVHLHAARLKAAPLRDECKIRLLWGDTKNG